MPRSGSSGTFAALAAALSRPVIFISIAFATDTLYLWTGLGTIAWNGQTWTGAGTLAEIGNVEEGSTVQARGTVLTLNGAPSSILNEVLLNLRLGKIAQLWLGGRNPDGSVIADPVASFVGLVDESTINDAGETCTISVNVEDVLIDLNRSVWRRYTNDDQTSDYPGDTAMQYIVGIQEITTYWGRVPNAWNR